jgi:hypothetical protein
MRRTFALKEAARRLPENREVFAFMNLVQMSLPDAAFSFEAIGPPDRRQAKVPPLSKPSGPAATLGTIGATGETRLTFDIRPPFCGS